jgi:hypothetical protein
VTAPLLKTAIAVDDSPRHEQRAPQRAKPSGVLLGEGVEVVVAVTAVGPATGALTAKVQLSEKFPAPA